MNENKFKKQLILATVIVLIVSISLSAVVFATWGYLSKTARNADNTQMYIETIEQKDNILKQLNKTLQILTTLSKAYEVSNIMESSEELERSIIETNAANSFISLAYIPVTGTGIINAPEYGTVHNFTLEDCHDYSKTAIIKSLHGENAISKMFDSQLYNDKIFVYSVPVYYQGKVVGALAASDKIEVFYDVVNADSLMSGRGYIHFINSDGKLLIRSKNTVVKDSLSSIFDGSYLSENTKKMTREAMANNKSISGEFLYNGETVSFYIEPLGFNNWFLYSARPIWSSIQNLGKVVVIVEAVLLFVLLIMLIILFYLYYHYRKNTLVLLNKVSYDSVTGAKNIYKFDHDFKEFREKYDNYSIAAINIHNFKFINYLFGKDGGNKVLCFIKKVIANNLNDGEFFCRASADLFYVFMLDANETIVKNRIKNIIDYVGKITSKADYSYEINLYAGIATQGDREQALLALQSIKTKYYENIAFYDKSLHDNLRKKNNIERYMQTALDNHEFKLFLQPKYNLKNNKLIGAEALVRWQKPDGTYRFPNEFIPIFESNGFCSKLDMYMIEETCKQLRKWMDNGIEPIPISVNQSKLLFFNGNYVNELQSILNKYNISSSLIILELLENVAIENPSEINKRIEELHGKGFRVSMDDFGSGYSSLNMLYKLKIDELKLDRGFLQKANDMSNKKRKILLEQIIYIAKKFGIKTVAEGIETQEDNDIMASMMCDFGQGYFYNKPISAKDFTNIYMKS